MKVNFVVRIKLRDECREFNSHRSSAVLLRRAFGNKVLHNCNKSVVKRSRVSHPNIIQPLFFFLFLCLRSVKKRQVPVL